ncbi:Bug family tripartite tricarboxylate transporter substrate binding protein [Pseudorhodoferax soli]|uniref:Tripartite-type tricarboxylate transporter receptor subunit TctC n=1 Tax=Pseudorhodoferax soli TaxID=545864 RepID=A0A368XKT0_9BURK|nr:tripartite tricarboxylate transporter substrate binding protein [Pseudorhodoferax soli]RCW68631.1 tripartite-type tricarboxylate transporter receptor subunit TctC [Pseudorhodoferax soli]
MRSVPRRPVLRRTGLAWLLGAGLAATLGSFAHAQGFPARPIHIVVPYPPGGAVDQVARLIAPKLEADLGKPVVVENKAGAGGLLGSDAVARAPADGHTLVFATVSSHAIAPAVYAKMPYDPITDFAMVSNVALTPYIITVNPNVPATTLKALVAYAKTNGSTLNFGSSGKGTTPHLAGELFNAVAGTRITHVPYKGSAPMVADLLANHVQVAFDNTVIPYIQAGRLIGLAVTGPRRLSSVPDIPTAAEAGLPGYEAVGWMGLMAPRGTPAAITERLSRATVQAVAGADVRAKLDTLGFQGDAGTPQAFEAFVRAERTKWSKVAHDAGIQPE